MPAALKREPMQQKLSDSSKPQLPGAFLRPAFRAATVAILIFALVNFALFRLVSDEKTSKDMWGGTGSIDLAVRDYASLKQAPKVVLLGSSLMMYPFWAMDKEAQPSIGDIFHHHKSATLAKLLRQGGMDTPDVYSFAIFGQMVSDAYIYVNEYLKGDKAPKYLVFGIAPRDFSDFDLPAPMATLTFKRLVGLSNLAPYANLYLPALQDKIDFLLGHTCFFYGRRWRLQHEVVKAVNKAYRLLGLPDEETAGAPADTAGFMIAGREDVRWRNSLNEYRRRYRNIDQKDLSIQMGFLKRLLEVCQERKIKVVLINMPLTEINRQLFPSNFYERFRLQVSQIAERPGITFLDLGSSKQFTHDDFWDTTHLNHQGGHKLLKELTPLLLPDSRRQETSL